MRTVRASGPKTRKAGTATAPAPAIFIIYDADEYNLLEQRTQRLCAAFGLPPRHARLIAGLAFGEAA